MDKEGPAEPVVGDKGTTRGGFAEVAKHLNREYPVRQRPISRQLVHKWWLYRHSNGFPEAIATSGSSGGTGRPVFDVTAIIKWYAKYCETRLRHNSLTTRQEPEAKTMTGTGDGSSLAA